MKDKTHWKLLTNPNYLGAYSLDPDKQEITLTIKSVTKELVKGTDGKEDQCTVAHFQEGGKPMILNKTNCKMITRLYETPYIEEWTGAQITIYAAKVKAFGDTVDALRIRDKRPVESLPNLDPAHPKWNAAKTAIEKNNTTLEKIRKSYTLTKENEKILCSK